MKRLGGCVSAHKRCTTRLIAKELQASTLVNDHFWVSSPYRIPSTDFNTVIGLATAGPAGEAIKARSGLESGACWCMRGQFDFWGVMATKCASMLE
jgi:hypothetical protein